MHRLRTGGLPQVPWVTVSSCVSVASSSDCQLLLLFEAGCVIDLDDDALTKSIEYALSTLHGNTVVLIPLVARYH